MGMRGMRRGTALRLRDIHGEHACYHAGCRCDLCLQAARQYRKDVLRPVTAGGFEAALEMGDTVRKLLSRPRKCSCGDFHGGRCASQVQVNYQGRIA